MEQIKRAIERATGTPCSIEMRGVSCLVQSQASAITWSDARRIAAAANLQAISITPEGLAFHCSPNKERAKSDNTITTK